MGYDQIVKDAVLELVSNHRAEFELNIQALCRDNGLKPFESVIPNFDAHLQKVLKKQSKEVQKSNLVQVDSEV